MVDLQDKKESVVDYKWKIKHKEQGNAATCKEGAPQDKHDGNLNVKQTRVW